MTRVQKKCFVFAVGMHALLIGILLVSAGFGERSDQTQMEVLTMIPANILDRAGAGGGSPAAPARLRMPAPEPQETVPQPRIQPAVRPLPTRAEPVEPVERSLPRETAQVEEETLPQESDNPIPTHHAKPHKHHEIQPTFAMANQSSRSRQSREPSEPSNARAEARRLKEIENSLDGLASNVRSSASPSTVVDVPGVGGGGESFAGYREVIFSYYYHAWITPDGVANQLASADARITVARDGTILSAELISRSGEPALDRSVRRALDAVSKLPPFPSSARDEQRTFVIRFNLESKEASG